MMPPDPDLVRVVHAETGEALDALLELSEPLDHRVEPVGSREPLQ